MTKNRFVLFILLTISLVSGIFSACNKPDANGGICDGGNSCSGDVSAVEGSGPFKIKVRVDPDDLTFLIGARSAERLIRTPEDGPSLSFLYNVDCDSDGTIEASNLSEDYTCKYSAPGDYTISITGYYPRPSFNFFDNDGEIKGCGKILEVENWGSQVWQDMTDAFKRCDTLVSVGNTKPDLSQVRSMKGMFDEASNFNSPIGFWDVSKVTNMSFMFSGVRTFNQLLNKWNVSKVTNMSFMFSGVRTFNQPLNEWNVSKATNMSFMFAGAESFNQPLDEWNVSKVTDMREMFSGASSFNQPLDEWNVSKVTDMGSMFARAESFNQALDRWDVSNVTDMSSMFVGASSFNQALDRWDVSNVINMSYMFAGASSFNQPLDRWDVSNVINMSYMFAFASSFNQDLSRWNTSHVKECYGFDDDTPSWKDNYKFSCGRR